MRFSGRHRARATSQQSMWPLEKYCPKLILNHQSWVTQWSQMQHLGLNIVFLFYSKDDHSARYPWPLCIYGGLREISFYTSDLHHPWSLTPGPPTLVPHEVIQLLSQPLGSKGSSFTSQHRPRRVVGESRSGEVGMKWGAVRGWAGRRRGQEGGDLLSSLCCSAWLVWAFLCFLYPLGLSRAVSSLLLHTLKSIGYRGVLNLKLCKPCQISVHSWFLIVLFILFPFKTHSQYWWPSASVSLQKDLNLLLNWPYLHLGKYLPLYKTIDWLNP